MHAQHAQHVFAFARTSSPTTMATRYEGTGTVCSKANVFVSPVAAFAPSDTADISAVAHAGTLTVAA